MGKTQRPEYFFRCDGKDGDVLCQETAECGQTQAMPTGWAELYFYDRGGLLQRFYFCRTHKTGLIGGTGE